MSTTEETLVRAAHEARARSYAPYSRYHVGCALAAGDAVYQGANIENASYGLSVCAERVACANAAMAGVRHVDTVVVVTQSSPPAGPCGACLQTLIEFCRDPRATQVILVNPEGERRVLSLAELIPHAFDKDQLTT